VTDKVQIKRVSKFHTPLSKVIYLLMVSSLTVHMKMCLLQTQWKIFTRLDNELMLSKG